MALLGLRARCAEGSIHLLRGNHEDTHINRAYGLWDQVKTQHGRQSAESLFSQLQVSAVLLQLCAEGVQCCCLRILVYQKLLTV